MWLAASSESTRSAVLLADVAGAPIGVTLIETLALLDGDKAGMRLVCSSPDVPRLIKLARHMGVQALVSRNALRTVQQGPAGDRYQEWARDKVQDGPHAVYLSLQQDVVESLRMCDSEGAESDLAGLLGYPECCRNSAEARSCGPWWWRLAKLGASEATLPGVANRLGRLYSHATYLYDYFPCTPDCTGSVALGMANRQRLLDHGCHELVNKWDTELHSRLRVTSSEVSKHLGGDNWSRVFVASGHVPQPDDSHAVDMSITMDFHR